MSSDSAMSQELYLKRYYTLNTQAPMETGGYKNRKEDTTNWIVLTSDTSGSCAAPVLLMGSHERQYTQMDTTNPSGSLQLTKLKLRGRNGTHLHSTVVHVGVGIREGVANHHATDKRNLLSFVADGLVIFKMGRLQQFAGE